MLGAYLANLTAGNYLGPHQRHKYRDQAQGSACLHLHGY